MITLRVGFTPDADDAFAYHALVTGRVRDPEIELRFEPRPIETLNAMVAAGRLDVAAVSSVFYPVIQDRYAMMRAGAAVGRGYGPRLVAAEPRLPADLAHAAVAVPGMTTTGATLLGIFFPYVRPRVMALDAIRGAVAAGEVAAGVLIHEELIDAEEIGKEITGDQSAAVCRPPLHRVACLGAEWERRTGLPLPIAVSVVRRELGGELCGRVAGLVERSIRHAFAHREEAFAWACRFARSDDLAITRRYVEMLVTGDTVQLGEDCERGLRALLDLVHDRFGGRPIERLVFVEPAPAPFAASAASGVTGEPVP